MNATWNKKIKVKELKRRIKKLHTILEKLQNQLCELIGEKKFYKFMEFHNEYFPSDNGKMVYLTDEEIAWLEIFRPKWGEKSVIKRGVKNITGQVKST